MPIVIGFQIVFRGVGYRSTLSKMERSITAIDTEFKMFTRIIFAFAAWANNAADVNRVLLLPNKRGNNDFSHTNVIGWYKLPESSTRNG